MQVIKIVNGETTVVGDSKFTHGYLASVTLEDGERRTYHKPTYPGEYDWKTAANINYNYDGMLLNLKFIIEEKSIKGGGYGWKECEFVVF
ncbi:hypothetical protein N1M2_56 [Klebsiella phage N1M2]|uniref:Uncharacterized protein n=1 Tax=Klebsiella phage N1M2 TaxID=2664939 RepID=A0A6B7ZF35_9CAUD|nr:hypothetical protein PQB72_gp056 [Klebsiella phage N1M2]QGH71919.1 hypothetical protein N1M2_56 [Klebsiella phage N1M2]